VFASLRRTKRRNIDPIDPKFAAEKLRPDVGTARR